jgi:23S rRNA pseudouridine1911/1915/1917 synthase
MKLVSAFSSYSPLEILFDEGGVIVVNKPGGVLTQAAPGIDSIEQQLKRLLLERANATTPIYLGVPHRIDRPVSGALMMATDKETTKALAGQFEKRSVKKTYWAIVAGDVEPNSGRWSDYMRKIPAEPRSEIVHPEHEGAQYALLNYRVIQRVDQFSWLEIALETGRTHQIRLQASSRRWPIVGDELYQSSTPFGPPSIDERERWIALHAHLLEFDHPSSGKRISIKAPLPSYWDEFAKRLGC